MGVVAGRGGGRQLRHSGRPRCLDQDEIGAAFGLRLYLQVGLGEVAIDLLVSTRFRVGRFSGEAPGLKCRRRCGVARSGGKFCSGSLAARPPKVRQSVFPARYSKKLTGLPQSHHQRTLDETFLPPISTIDEKKFNDKSD